MNNLIIWSKNRACQLNLLLDSIKSNCPNFFDKIGVVFTCTNKDFYAGYNIVSDLHPSVNFYKQQDKYDNEYLTRALVNNPKNSAVYFSTDDTVIYRQNLGEPPSIHYGECFSLRLGLNTIIQNCHSGEIQPPLNNYIKDGDQISWNPHRYYPISNYGYCFGLDMCGYNATQMQNIFKQIRFKNSNELESALFKFRDSITVMRSYERSIAVNVPMNNMSGVTQSMNISQEDLNYQFLAGRRLELPELLSVIGCHQEINLQLC